MSTLHIQDLAKAFGIRQLFNDVTFDIDKGDKIGLIGANGVGKTTLLNCIMGIEDYDGGIIKLDPVDRIGYVQQQAEFTGATLYDEFLTAFEDVLLLGGRKSQLEKAIDTAAQTNTSLDDVVREYAKVAEEFERRGGYEYENDIRRIAFGLGFSEAELHKSPLNFSGGQKTRICLAKALLREPDFLFLDEPTNHLDISMIEWLEDFLKNYRGGVLMISHDRFFLDKVTTSIMELVNGKIDKYEGNYTRALQVRNERRAALESAFIKQQEHIKKTEEYIRRYKAGIKSKQARGREKQLNRLERIILPPDASGFNYFLFNPPVECAQKVLEVEDAAFSFGTENVFRNISLTVRKGDGAALVGPNGVGKTTLLKLVVGELEPDSGRIKIGSRVKIGYFSQYHDELSGENNVLREITDNYGVTDEQARNYLGTFLFRSDDVYKIVADLSGGEKSRLALLKLMMDGANFIILDEPTNHLDIPAREAVEKALMSFPGTFLVVSHDRYFLDKVTNCTYEMENGSLTQYDGNYSYYRLKKSENIKAMDIDNGKILKDAKSAKSNNKKNTEKIKTGVKENHSIAFASEDKKQQLQQRCEAQIAMLEVELKGLEREMNDPLKQQDLQESQKIARDYAAKQQEIDAKYQEWDKLLE
ncbi:ABC-F family ATP-binding cassette domain-containing protein [Pectinatus frisingensis]|uniref:ABC-F family ATP-binding cassette domain-containing protein n=1 Tax=Pectinatus frisingensis TaxID=865 RepID=UPI0018C815AB|nr:ABC-F family ATP-binding cassette domain-containing protein [Pectinatus frisingensis]